MTMTSGSSVGTTGRERDADQVSDRTGFAQEHPVVFGLLGVLIALMLTFAALQALMMMMPSGAPGA